MQPLQPYPVLRNLLAPLRRSQQKSIAWALLALLHVGRACCAQMARWLSGQLGIQMRSALNRVYRLLRGDRVDWEAVEQQLLRLLSRRLGRRLLIALDWTEWRGSLRMLVASVPIGTRALLLRAKVIDYRQLTESQNRVEDAFVQRMATLLQRCGLQAVLLADRGFRRVSLLRRLQQLRLGFVIRLCDNVQVRSAAHQKAFALRRRGLPPGQAVDLAAVWLRHDGAVAVRVLGLWAAGCKQPWWLATNLTEPPERIVSYYERRSSVEQHIRDHKGCRFGSQLAWSQLRTPRYLERLARLLGLAELLWTAVGSWAAQQQPSLLWLRPGGSPRCSLLRLGRELVQWLATKTKQKLTARRVAALLPQPQLRRFAWPTQTPSLPPP